MGKGGVRVDGNKIRRVWECMRRVYPEAGVSEDELRAVAEEAYVAADHNYGVEKAIEWGRGFEWDKEVAVRDLERLKRNNYNIEEMTREQHCLMADRRLSVARIERWIAVEDPDRERLINLAEGMVVLADDGFVPNNRTPKQRSLYLRARNPVNKLFQDMWSKDLVFIVPTVEVNGVVKHLHPAGWAPKWNKACGRQIGDVSDHEFGPALNSEGAKAKLKEMYSDIRHPTVEDLVGMVNEFAEEKKRELGDAFNWDDLVLFKGDLAMAFTLLFVRPDGVRLFACELTDGLTLFYHTGFFGWTGTPFAFQVITRVLERALKALKMPGSVKIYVDDLMGVCMKADLIECRRIITELCEGLLGPTAIAEKKWEDSLATGQIDWIGWQLDLRTRKVNLARRNFLKVLYGFCEAKENAPMRVIELMKLASWASRYSMILRQMRPFSAALYSDTGGVVSMHAFRELSTAAKIAVQMWMVLLALLNIDERRFSRAFSSFGEQLASVSLEYDASLEGVGVILRTIHESQLIGVGAVPLPFRLEGDSGFQNTVEFTACTLGIAGLAQLGYRAVNVRLVGDNRTSLKWGSTERFKGTLGLRAAIVFVLVSIAFDIWVTETVHVPGVDHVIPDALSRGRLMTELGFRLEDSLRWEDDRALMELLVLCDPTEPIRSVSELCDMWASVRAWVHSVMTGMSS